MKELDLTVHLSFAEDISEDDIEDVAINVMSALVNEADHNQLAPDHTITRKIEVSHSGLSLLLRLF